MKSRQPQLPRTEPNGQPIESSHLEHRSEVGNTLGALPVRLKQSDRLGGVKTRVVDAVMVPAQPRQICRRIVPTGGSGDQQTAWPGPKIAQQPNGAASRSTRRASDCCRGGQRASSGGTSTRATVSTLRVGYIFILPRTFKGVSRTLTKRIPSVNAGRGGCTVAPAPDRGRARRQRSRSHRVQISRPLSAGGVVDG